MRSSPTLRLKGETVAVPSDAAPVGTLPVLYNRKIRQRS